MCRDELRLNRGSMSDAKLHALWRALDEDGSGWVSAGEFGHFMRRRERKDASASLQSSGIGRSAAEEAESKHKQRVADAREARNAALEEEERVRLLAGARRAESVAAALKDEVERLEAQLAKMGSPRRSGEKGTRAKSKGRGAAGPVRTLGQPTRVLDGHSLDGDRAAKKIIFSLS